MWNLKDFIADTVYLSARHSWLDCFKDNLKDLRFENNLVWEYTVILKELLLYMKLLRVVFILFSV